MTLHDEIKKGLVESIAVTFWAMKDGDAHDLKDACDVAHTSMKAAMIYIQQLEAERDAALADFKLYRERNIKGECGVYACDLCKRGGRYEDWDEIKCPTGCTGVSHWEWRGVQKEE